MTPRLQTILELCGFALLAAAGFLVSIVVGLVVAGAILVLLGNAPVWRSEPRGRRSQAGSGRGRRGGA